MHIHFSHKQTQTNISEQFNAYNCNGVKLQVTVSHLLNIPLQKQAINEENAPDYELTNLNSAQEKPTTNWNVDLNPGLTEFLPPIQTLFKIPKLKTGSVTNETNVATESNNKVPVPFRYKFNSYSKLLLNPIKDPGSVYIQKNQI